MLKLMVNNTVNSENSIQNQKIEIIGKFDQLRITTQYNSGDVSGIAVFKDGRAMHVRTSAEEVENGVPLHKAHFVAASGAAKTIFEKVDDILKKGDHTVKRALFTFPHLPERKAEFYGSREIS
jgi:hypothetical protein